MFNRNWIAALTLGLTLALQGEAQERPEPKPEPKNTHTEPAKEPAINPPRIAPTASAPTKVSSPQHNEAATPDGGSHLSEIPELLFGDGWAQWLMAFTGIGALAVSVWAVSLLQKTLRATRDAVSAANKANDAALLSVTNAQDIGQRQVRAYLGFSSGNVVQDEHGAWRAALSLTNGGQSPAHQIRAKISYEIVPKGKSRGFYFKNEAIGGSASKIDVGPGQSQRLIVSIGKIIGDQMIKVATSEKDLIVFATIVYRDAFNRTRRSTFLAKTDFYPLISGERKLNLLVMERGNHSN